MTCLQKRFPNSINEDVRTLIPEIRRESNLGSTRYFLAMTISFAGNAFAEIAPVKNPFTVVLASTLSGSVGVIPLFYPPVKPLASIPPARCATNG